MPRGYVLSPEAQDDIAGIRAYYPATAGARVARYVLAEITRAFGSWLQRPEQDTAAPILRTSR